MGEAQARRGRTTGKDSRHALPDSPPPPICQVPFCPICMTVTAVGEIKPEVVEHLLLAGRELMLAFKAVIDAHLEGTESRPAEKLERLTIE
jgi:hypothetical protein